MKKSSDETGMSRTTLSLPERLWKILLDDAIRCHRTHSQQIAAILSVYYEHADVNVNSEAIEKAAEIVSHKPRNNKRSA